MFKLSSINTFIFIFAVDILEKYAVPSYSSELKIAVITAGSIRSFAYVEKSWHRYMIMPWRPNIYIFAHAVMSSGCPIFEEGLRMLKAIATKVEVSAETPLHSKKFILKNIPDHYHQYINNRGRNYRGNVFDMHARRSRAYELSEHYAEKHNITWDLIMLMRLDSAFYSPILNFPKWYHYLKYKEYSGMNGVFVPTGCDFGGYCDRFAIGLPNVMKVYFQEGFIFQVLRWSLEPTNDDETINSLKNIIQSGELREQIVMAWFFMNKWERFNPNPLAFITLRALYSEAYCYLNRTGFLEFRNPNFLSYGTKWDEAYADWTDKTTAYFDQSSPSSGFDDFRSPYERCGKSYSTNFTDLCLKSLCPCDPWG